MGSTGTSCLDNLILGEDDDPVHVLLDENNVAMLLFKDEKDVVIGAPAVASALATKKSRGAQVLERSALLGAIFFSAEDDAGEKGDELGDTLGGTPSANARAAAARGVAGGVKAPLRLPSPAAPGKAGLGTPSAGGVLFVITEGTFCYQNTRILPYSTRILHISQN